MKSNRLRKNKSLNDFLFFFGFVILTISFFISFVTMKNDCIYLRNQIYHINSIKTSHLNRVKVLSGKVKELSGQGRIEKVAKEKFDLHAPAPESLTVYLGINGV